MDILKPKRELKINIEAMTQCGASCLGCILPPDLKASQNFWSEEFFSKGKNFLLDYISYRQSKYNDLLQINLAMGQGDYFQLKNEQVNRVIDFIVEVGQRKSSAFLTASGITKHEALQKSVDDFYQKSIDNQQPLLIEFVLDSSKIMKQEVRHLYEKNISYIVNKFGHVDFVINLNQDTVQSITPEKLDQFILKNKLSFVALGLNPSFHNQKSSKSSWSDMISWLNNFIKIVRHGKYELELCSTITNKLAGFKEEIDSQKLKNERNEFLKDEIFIDNLGNVYFQQNGFGAGQLSNRNGFESFINIFDYKGDIEDLFENAVQKTSKTILRKMMNVACMDCEYKQVCSLSAITGMMNVLGNLNDECPVLIKRSIQLIDEQRLPTLSDGKIFTQRKFVTDNIDESDLEKMIFEDHDVEIKLKELTQK